jgi:hypothetical protein
MVAGSGMAPGTRSYSWLASTPLAFTRATTFLL